jgi:predicted enzyme related to lactoylglutathione lyase
MKLRWEVCIDCVDPEALAPFWEGLLGYERGEQWGPYVELRDPSGRHPNLRLQRVPEAKTVKNRLHLDLYSREAEELLARARELGDAHVGERRRSSDDAGQWFQVLTDPAGNEFCICTEPALQLEDESSDP